MIRILLDQGLPRTAAAQLQKAGWDVLHTFDAGLSRTSDVELLEVARRERRTVVTLDADFHAILAVADITSPSVIRIRLEGLRGEGLAELLISIWPKIDAFARKQNGGWISKKRQMQGAQLSSNETYLRTSKQREQLQQRSSW